MSEQIPPARIIQDLAVAYWVSRCLHLVAELRVADHLADAPESADRLASACGAQPQVLNRVLRALANHGVFEYDGRRFSHNLVQCSAHGKVLLVEGIVRAETHDDFVKDLDIEMLAMTTGRERTESEWDAVLTRAGFRLTGVIPVGSWSSILEAEIS